MIPYGKQDITQKDIDAVVDVLRSDFLTQGPQVPAFEAEIASYCGADYAVSVNSATSALHIACLALGLGQGDWLWTTPISFVASANCGAYCGACIDFVDIDPKTYNLSADSFEEKLKTAETQGQLPKVLVAVHLCGQPCEMDKIKSLADQYGVFVIEDASHAIGGKYKGQAIGSCQYSDITVFSFHPVKIITTAEGGMALTNQQHLAEKMELLRSHGVTRDSSKMTKEPDGGWYYQQVDLGFNYRMTDLQAALGRSQLPRLDDYVSKRNAIAEFYDQVFTKLPLTTPFQHADSYSGRHLYVVRLDLGALSKSHKQVFSELRDAGVGVNLHYIPIHLQPFYERMGFALGDFPEAENYYSEAISLPMFPTLSQTQISTVVEQLNIILE